MKNLLLIAFATVALCLGANVLNACPDCEGKTVVKTEKTEKKADSTEVAKTDKTADADADKTADTKAASETTTKACSDCKGSCKRASAGQLVKAEKRAAATNCGGCGSGCGGGCGSGGGCAGGCGGGESGACDKAKTVKN
jgi:hypothetical protein